MSKPYPNRRRRRPGRQPPNRFSGRYLTPSARGYTGPGFKQLWDLFLPLRGRDRREFFNTVSATIALAGGLTGALIGFSCFGLLGGIFGLGAGVTLGGSIAERGRFYRR
jgi:hypothetical protein